MSKNDITRQGDEQEFERMSLITSVAVLFVKADSIYKTLPGCDCYDIERDALTFAGGMPVVAHPPCRAWGSLRHFARLVPGERELATWAVDQVREWGGVLEHPARSRLWPAAGLPEPNERDEHGGWTLAAPQMWWGHSCNKATWFYIVGVEPNNTPSIPFKLGEAPMVISTSHKCRRRPEISKSKRGDTPLDLARWLLELARRSDKCGRLTGV